MNIRRSMLEHMIQNAAYRVWRCSLEGTFLPNIIVTARQDCVTVADISVREAGEGTPDQNELACFKGGCRQTDQLFKEAKEDCPRAFAGMYYDEMLAWYLETNEPEPEIAKAIATGFWGTRSNPGWLDRSEISVLHDVQIGG